MKTLVSIIFTILLSFVAGGTCQGDPCSKSCPRNYSPVCITLQRTMPNKCEAENEACRLRAEGFTVKRQSGGACQCRGACTREYRPLCGRHIHTGSTQLFSNPCLLDLDICQGNPRKVVPLGECQK